MQPQKPWTDPKMGMYWMDEAKKQQSQAKYDALNRNKVGAVARIATPWIV